MFGHIERRINDEMVSRKWDKISEERNPRKSRPQKNLIEVIRLNIDIQIKFESVCMDEDMVRDRGGCRGKIRVVDAICMG